MTDTPTYRTWQWMLYRIRHDPKYKDRRVCQSWHDSFDNFYADMGDRPEGERVSLGRIDNDGDYSPENCQWETPTQQNRNKGDTVLIASQNLGTKSLTEWSYVLAAQTRDFSWTPRALKATLKRQTLDQLLKGMGITELPTSADCALDQQDELIAA